MRNRFAAFVTKGVGSAEALRHVSDRLTAKAVVVLSAEAILGAPLREVLAMHVAREATLSAVFARKAKATAKDAKAKQPAPSDYVGLPAPKGAKAGTSNALEPQAQLIFAAAGHSDHPMRVAQGRGPAAPRRRIPPIRRWRPPRAVR